ncbi:MAG: hypothetical protein FD169_2336 [Bacillota bacterium]|nr:MAG: hypothetical protein FD169_2336 [Bacillota bacterium]MBS3949950.1 DUF1850 domain-containing protein [Peptococcaceae bacterium]
MFHLAGAPRRGALSLLLILGILLVIGVLVTTFYSQQQVLVVRVEDKVLSTIPIEAGDSIIYSFRHSVEKTIVEEYLEVAPPGFLLTHTRMQSFGAGLPSDITNGFTLDRDWYMLPLSRYYATIPFRVTGFAEQLLRIKEHVISFALFTDGSVINLELTRRPIIWLRLKGVMN